MSNLLWAFMAMLLAGFYSGSETGFYCMSRLRIALRARKGQKGALVAQRLDAQPALAISSMLVGTNLGIYLATVLVTMQLRQWGAAELADLYSSLILPPILLIVAEVIPKSLFQHHADYLMYRVAFVLRASQSLFYPFAALLVGIAKVPMLLVRKHASPPAPSVTPDTFRFYLKEGVAQGALSPFQGAVAENIMRLRSVKLIAAMTPLDKVVMIAQDAPYDELVELVRRHRYSRIPVYEGSRDRIVGAVNVIDVALAEERARLMRELAEGVYGGSARVSVHLRDEPTVRGLMRGVLSLRGDMSVAEALWALRQAKQQLAVVADGQERALGVVTMKDLVEEIVGDLEAW